MWYFRDKESTYFRNWKFWKWTWQWWHLPLGRQCLCLEQNRWEKNKRLRQVRLISLFCFLMKILTKFQEQQSKETLHCWLFFQDLYMGQFLQGGNFGHFVSYFFLQKVEPSCDQAWWDSPVFFQLSVVYHMFLVPKTLWLDLWGHFKVP